MSDWLPDHIAELIRLRAEGLSAAAIARTMGEQFTRSAVCGKLFRLGLMAKSGPQPIRQRLGGRKARPLRLVKPDLERTAAGDYRPPEWPEEPIPLGPINDFTPPHTCKFIRADIDKDWRCCGHQALPEQSWCAFHYGVVFNSVPSKPLKDQQKIAEAA